MYLPFTLIDRKAANSNGKEKKNHEHTYNRADRGCCSRLRLCILRTLAREQMGHRSQGQDPGRRAERRKGLRSDQRLDGIQPSVFVYRRRRPCDRRNSGRSLWLAAGAALGADRRRILRRGHGLRCAVRLGQEQGQVDGHADREVYRQDRPQAVPRIFVDFLLHRYRGVR